MGRMLHGSGSGNEVDLSGSGDRGGGCRRVLGAARPGVEYARMADHPDSRGECRPRRLRRYRFLKKTWVTAKLPGPDLPKGGYADPQVIAAASATDIWADAEVLNSSDDITGVLLLHYNGKAWIRVPVPYKVYPEESVLAPDGSGGAWFSDETQYIYHDSAGHWTRVAAPAARGYGTFPVALAWIPGTRSVWAAGSR
jgi:hypothetical protein